MEMEMAREVMTIVIGATIMEEMSMATIEMVTDMRVDVYLMESVIDISNCATNQRVKYATCSLVGKALTWWNTQIQARGGEAVVGMAWDGFKTLLKEYYPNNEMPKLENEFWNHTMVGMDWLSKLRKEIVCHEKIIRIHLPNGEILKVRGERSEEDLKHLMSMKTDEKKLEDIPIVRGIIKVSPEEITG
ncbi:hypothetical protein Tco_0237141 [Tanacetum coccineum]